MEPRYVVVVVCCLLGILPTSARGAFSTVSSTFDVDAEGWIAQELGGSTNTMTYHATGGNPGGYLNALDIQDGRTWYWIAPSKFLGNDSQAYGGALSFDLREHGTGAQYDDIDVRLTGGGLTIAFNTPNNPAVGNTWTHYSVGLVETGWHLNDLNGAAVTQAQFQQVLASLTSLRIRGEYVNGDDNGDLDNVIMEGPATGVPAPGGLTLLGVGTLGLLGWSRLARRRVTAPVG